MTKQVFEVRSFDMGPGNGHRVIHHVELDNEWFCGGKLPAILVFEDGLTAYRYMDYYVIEDGYFVSSSNIVKKDL